MYFDAQPLPEVEAFVKKHYKGGTVLDFGCGCGRYTHLFSDKDYLGIDGFKNNIKFCRKTWPDKKFLVKNLEIWRPRKKFDYLFSSVVFDQVKNLPKGWAKTYILIENKKYRDIYKPHIDEPLQGSEETRMMVCRK